MYCKKLVVKDEVDCDTLHFCDECGKLPNVLYLFAHSGDWNVDKGPLYVNVCSDDCIIKHVKNPTDYKLKAIIEDKTIKHFYLLL